MSPPEPGADPALVRQLAPKPDEPPLRLRQGVVQAVAGVSCTVRPSGSEDPADDVAGVAVYAHVGVAVGDTVEILAHGADWRVVGLIRRAASSDPFMDLSRGSVQGVPNNTVVSLAFTGGEDPAAMSALVGGVETVVTIPRTARWEIGAGVEYVNPGTANGPRHLLFVPSAGQTLWTSAQAAANYGTGLNFSRTLRLNAGVTFVIRVLQLNSAAATLDLAANKSYLTARPLPGS